MPFLRICSCLLVFAAFSCYSVRAHTVSGVPTLNQSRGDTAASLSTSRVAMPLVSRPPSSTAPNTSPWPSTGPIGFGTTTPTSQLSVIGNIDITGGHYFGYSLNDNFTYESSTMPHYGSTWTSDTWTSAGPTYWLSSYGGIKFFSQGIPRMVINVSGAVGIGTASPAQNFAVSNGGAEGLEVYLGQPAGTVGLQVYNRTASAYNKMELDASQFAFMDGNVGIGTKNPQSLFSVEGNMTAKQMTVLQTGWSDFVFDSSYQKISLDSVSQYIGQYKHLPHVPSAAEVEKEGLDLGAMQELHMHKIEELTLYIIDEDAHIKKQDTTIAVQQGQIKVQGDLLLELREQLKAQQAEIEQLKQKVK